MSLRPWREIARPHQDVLEGSFKQSEFASDITQVATGTAPSEYQDPVEFFSRTYITEGMRLLLVSVAQRLAGEGGDPVVQLQTAFGGGKTHTMLAVYHLAQGRVPPSKLEGVPAVLDEAGIAELPASNIAVIDGIKLAPSQSRQYDGLTVNTLWGELAYQLLGQDGYAMVAESDATGTSPGKEVLANLIRRAAPCVILIDELVAFIRQLELDKHYAAGTFDSNLSFVQGLTEAMKSVPNAILLASLPESELEVGGTLGQSALNSLEKYFARVESVWKPVGAEEAFEIVRRRLFETAGDPGKVQGIARQFSDYYRANADKFPVETQSNEYYERICSSYPIHPEIFDRLYEDWSTLDKFQRTRGVLQYMAIVIHRLWNSDNSDALIMPGSLPLEDTNVRNKSIHYLPQGWEPVIEKEVDGPRSVPQDIDGHHTLFGSVQAARRTMRTIFLGSAPSSAAQSVRGLQAERVLLGAVQPEQTIGVFEDVLKRLRDRLHYLYSEADRFWLDTKPNLRREMESRKQNISDSEQLLPLLKERVTRVFGRAHSFSGIHVFTRSADVPDDYGVGPRLVVLEPDHSYSRTDADRAAPAAEQVLKYRGEQPRQKQNRLIFLAPDFDVVSRMKEQGRSYLAWRSIVNDIEDGTLNQDLSHLNQAKRNVESAESSLNQVIREAYKWLLAPIEEFVKGAPTLKWEAVAVSPTAPNLVQAIEEKLREEEWVIYQWSPIHLRNVLNRWYLKDGVSEVSALRVWQDCCHYLYLPRLLNDQVYRQAIAEGVESGDYFGFAAAKEGGDYLGFILGDGMVSAIDEQSLLVELDIARSIQAERASVPAAGPDESGQPYTGSGSSSTPIDVADGPNTTRSGDSGPRPTPSAPVDKRFYGTVELNPVRASMDFSTIVNEVIEQFTARTDTRVTISVEINAESRGGFDESLKRAVRENCATLRFGASEFEEE
ncbi:ATP-binding protein [Spiribacter onubensis]|uniref:DUF499 domain-containing protein n=1 Tax=Spiribacter onubensis TaxID=3122420 RepID=A0ABV3S6L2_9GAMM